MGTAKLLSGGNPQIPKGEGDGPVQAYIEAMPGWKNGIGRQLDDLISAVVPDAQKAVKWNTPFYGIPDNGWFVAFHCFERYVKVTFFKGASLSPPPPVVSKQDEVRYVHLHEDETINEELLRSWLTQAANLPGAKL